MKNNLLWLLTFLIGICGQNTAIAQCAGFSAAATAVSNYNGQAVSCFGAADGMANVVATGGTSPYSYLWSGGGQTGSMATGLSAGVYTVLATDAIGCTVTAAVTITQPTQVIVNNFNQINVSCFGGANGFACVSATGGVAPYAFIWSNGQNTTCATGLPAGNHTVTVIDVNGCAGVATATITQPATAMQASIGSQTNATCLNANGAACASASGGSAPYTFIWNTGQITSCASGLLVGSYMVTVTDMNGCTGVATTTITNASVSSVSVTATTVSNYSGQAVSCFGAADGEACATASGGTAPYIFLWANGQTTSCAWGLTAGSHTVTVTDANGCAGVSTVTITQPTQVIINNPNQSNVSCFGGADGSACILALGGVGFHSFTWSSGQNTSCISGLMAGNYMVTVMDANGCAATRNFILLEPTALAANIGAPIRMNNNCQSFSATVNASGGVAPYSYLWSNGQSTAQAQPLLANSTHQVTITDANACMLVRSVTLPNISPSTVQLTELCPQNGFGRVVATPTGNPPHTYIWNDGQTTNIATGLTIGATAAVTVTDGNNCIAQASHNVLGTGVGNIAYNHTIADNACLMGLPRGSIQITMTNATPPISYLWSTGATTEDISGLAAGTYQLVVQDANCSEFAQFTVGNSNTPFSPSLAAVSNINGFGVACNGGNNGFIQTAVQGGTAPISYLWSTSNTTADVQNLPAGAYQVSITDATNCQFVLDTILTQPAQALQASIAQNCQLASGNVSATAVVTGGIMPYSYVWSNGQTTAEATGLSIGSMATVSVSDQNGCQVQHTITISNNGNTIGYTPQISHTTCGINSYWGHINLSVTAANPTFRWSNGQQTQNISGLAAGIYTVTISAQGCQEIATFTVGGISIMPQITPIFCANAGTIQLNGNLPYQYLWSNGSTNATLSTQISQYYSVTITDPVSGCVIVQYYYLANNCYSVVEGRVNYVDANGNCTGATPYNTAVWLRHLHSNNVYMTYSYQGFYRFYVNQSDSFEVFIDTTRPALQTICPSPARQAIHVPAGQSVTVPSFYVDMNGDDLVILPLSGIFSPGFTRSLCISIRNDGEAVNSPFVVLQYPPTVQFVSTATPHQHDAANHQITLTLPSMPHNQSNYICLNFLTPIGTPLGTMLPFAAAIYPLAQDLTPSNNTRQNIFTVVGSYDPNDKQVQPFHTNNEFLGGVIFPEEDTLHYIVRFQNTGTAPAEFVIIRDTLDAHLLPETIHNIETSHNANVRLAGGELVFEMDNIMLPDSATDLEGSQGFVKFSILRDNTLPLGTNIANTAAIYFDYNLPIITNTTNSVVDILSALERTPTTQHQWKVMPNPFDEHLTIQYTLHQSSATQIYLVNALGQTVQMLPQQSAQTAGEYQTQISTQALPSGIYWIVLETAQGKLAQKIVKQGSR